MLELPCQSIKEEVISSERWECLNGFISCIERTNLPFSQEGSGDHALYEGNKECIEDGTNLF